MGAKPRIRLDRVELWAHRNPSDPNMLYIATLEKAANRLAPRICSPPNARGEYPIVQPGNAVPVVLRPDWSRYRK